MFLYKQDDVFTFLQEGKTALHVAAEKGHLKVVDILLTSNADPNAETTVSM